MKRVCVCVKFVPRLLTDDQREQRQTIARDLFERSCEDVQFLKSIVTGNESWVYGHDPETKQQSSKWKGPTSPRPKKGRQVRNKTKVMLLAFFDSEGIVHHEHAADGQTINKKFYVEVMRRLRSPKTTRKMAGWRLDPAPRQCVRIPFTSCAAVFGQTRKNFTKKEYEKNLHDILIHVEFECHHLPTSTLQFRLAATQLLSC